jgi:hypothetical protein
MHSFLFKFSLVLNSLSLCFGNFGLRVPARYIRNFALFNVHSSYKNRLSATESLAADVLSRDVDIFETKNFLLYHIL